MSNIDPPRNFREVGIMLADIRGDLDDLKEAQRTFIARLNTIVLAVLCPLLVGVILGVVFQ